MRALPKLLRERFAVKTTFVSAVCLTAAIAAYATCDKSLGGLDARKIDRITLFYGIWLCRDSAERPHGFEVSSIRIDGRDAH